MLRAHLPYRAGPLRRARSSYATKYFQNEALELRRLLSAFHVSTLESDVPAGGALSPRISVYGDGQATADVITGQGPGVEARVSTWSFGAGPRQTIDIASAAPQVAAGDVNGDGISEVIVGQGPGAEPLVTVL